MEPFLLLRSRQLIFYEISADMRRFLASCLAHNEKLIDDFWKTWKVLRNSTFYSHCVFIWNLFCFFSCCFFMQLFFACFLDFFSKHKNISVYQKISNILLYIKFHCSLMNDTHLNFQQSASSDLAVFVEAWTRA